MKTRDVDGYEYVTRITDLENFFNVHERGDNYVFNLNETCLFRFDKTDLDTFAPPTYMFWTTISYSLYETTALAWLLMKINDVGAKSMFEPVAPGQTIYCPKKAQVQTIVEQINN